MLKKLFLFSFILLLSGCAITNNLISSKKEPSWLLDPYTDGDKYAATGCAKKHFKGEEAQKNLAISRAVDRVASQVKITVDNATYRQKSINNGKRGSSSSQSSSLQTVDNVAISTKTKAIYKKTNGEICAWVVKR
jgi:hypothetical protein